MRNFKLQLALALVAGICVAFIAVQATYAWQVNYTWNNRLVSFGFDSFPTGSWRDRARNAASQWTNVSTTNFTFQESAFTWDVHLYNAYIDGATGTVAGTNPNPLCSGHLCISSITTDSSENWYTGTGTPSIAQYDLYSVLTHEFGHAAGLGHTNGTGPSCSGSTQPTMCASIVGGESWWRTLATDDINGLTNAYP